MHYCKEDVVRSDKIPAQIAPFSYQVDKKIFICVSKRAEKRHVSKDDPIGMLYFPLLFTSVSCLTPSKKQILTLLSKMDRSVTSSNKPHVSIREGSYLKNREDKGAAELDINQMIEESGCSEVYFKLEECLGEHNREWRKCQLEVKQLQQCSKLHPTLGSTLMATKDKN